MIHPHLPHFDFKKRLRPRVYSWAVYLVGIFLLVQVAAVVSVFWFRKAVVKIEFTGPSYSAVPVSLPSETKVAPLPSITPPPSAEALTTNNLSTEQISGRLNVQPVSLESQIFDYNNQARELRRQNDFVQAEAALKKALELDATHLTTLINLAMLEEARGDNAKALEYWQRIMKTSAKSESTLRLARDRATVVEERIRQEGAIRDREALVLRSPRKFIIDRIIYNPVVTSDREMQYDFILKAGQDAVDPSKMRIQVFFYDRLSNGDLVPSRVDAKFLNTQPRWTTTTTETLRVKYYRPTKNTDDKRVYHGYLIRLIYDNEVQDERAEPMSLLTVFPFTPK